MAGISVCAALIKSIACSSLVILLLDGRLLYNVDLLYGDVKVLKALSAALCSFSLVGAGTSSIGLFISVWMVFVSSENVSSRSMVL